MNILIINPMLYTSVSNEVKREESIKDTMIYGLCKAFVDLGHDVVLFAGEPFRPTEIEEYPFKVIWGKYELQSVLPISLPWIPELSQYLDTHGDEFDLIISGEAFSLCTFSAYRKVKDKLICWHELAVHQRAMCGFPSRFWYRFFLPLFMPDLRVVARSEQAKSFISQYAKNVSDVVVGHGVDLSKYQNLAKKDNSFLVCSRLVPNKRIDRTISIFGSYVKKYDNSAVLRIAGTGEEEPYLRKLCSDLGIASNTLFLGQLNHERLLPFMATAWALLINTERDNSLISVIESIASGTPVITSEVPLNAHNIKAFNLGIVDNGWDEDDLKRVVELQSTYRNNCLNYRESISTKATAQGLISVAAGWSD